MSYNGSGTFQINTSGQPVVDGTAITASVFNALTADLASGLSTALTKDGQTTPTANLPMGGYKLTGLGLGLNTTDSARMDNAIAPGIMECRIGSDYPNSGGGLRTADGSTTIYLFGYKGNKISLYNGTQWVLRSVASGAGSTLTVPSSTNTNYDVFAYDNSGTVTLEAVAWSTDTSRTTGLVYQDGVLCKSGSLTRRYIGTIRTGGSSGQVRDTATHRFVWNYYNRVAISAAFTTVATWTYTTGTFRQANNDSSYQVDFVLGVNDECVQVDVVTSVRNSSTAVACVVGIGLNATTNSATLYPTAVTQVANIQTPIMASYRGMMASGRRYCTWLEKSVATGTTTWNDTGIGGIYATFMG